MATNGSNSNYIKWDAPGVEKPLTENEKKRITDVSGQFCRFQTMQFNEHQHCKRGTHPKTQGCVKGRFIVSDNLPDHLRQGMFKTPGTYDCIMRYSTLTPKLIPDNVPAPRGIGIKIFGVKGEKLWGEDKETQDWTFNNYPILELRDPQVTYEIADSLERNWNQLDKFVEEQKARPDAKVATYGGGLPQQSMVAMPEYSQSAYRFGDLVAKFGVFPLGEEQKKIEDWRIKSDDPVNAMSQHVRDFHAKHRVTYSFCAQLLQSVEEQPVDDIGIVWDETRYPFEQIATMEFDPQESFDPQFIRWWSDRITVNSWHGLVEHEPLGSTNKMRRVVYADSRKHRLKMNGYSDYIEPSSMEDVPNGISQPEPALAQPVQANAVEAAA